MSSGLELPPQETDIDIYPNDCLLRICYAELFHELDGSKTRLKVKRYLKREEAIPINPTLGRVDIPAGTPPPKKRSPPRFCGSPCIAEKEKKSLGPVAGCLPSATGPNSFRRPGTPVSQPGFHTSPCVSGSQLVSPANQPSGCALIAFGMVLQFAMHLTSFVRRRVISLRSLSPG